MHVGGAPAVRPARGRRPGLPRRALPSSRSQVDGRRAAVPQAPVPLAAHRCGQWALARGRRASTSSTTSGTPRCPQPGRVRELLALTSRLHGTLLDRKRPLWEAHLIEGLEGDRFAVYTKIHHAMMDGVSALRLLQRSLSTDPDARDVPVPWEPRRGPQPRAPAGGPWLLRRSPLPKAALQLDRRRRRADADAAAHLAERRRCARRPTALPMQAPREHAQRRHHRQPPLRRRVLVDGPAQARSPRPADATVNDVVLAMCSGALRAYLLELDALPGSPLVAMTPVSLRADENDRATGNAVGTILCNLATDLDAPRGAAGRGPRLDAARQGRPSRGLNQTQITALSRRRHGAAAARTRVLGLHKVAPPPYNLVISNVPGPEGAALLERRADARASTRCRSRLDGQALNITRHQLRRPGAVRPRSAAAAACRACSGC